MKRRLLAMVLLLAVVLTAFAGCGAPKVPNKKQIKQDIALNGLNCFELDYQEEILKVDSVEITKRKSDDYYDEVYVSAVLEHDYYTVEAEYVLYYSLYDVGGWVLDYGELTTGFLTVKKSPYVEDVFLDMLKESLTDVKIINRESQADGYNMYFDEITFKGSCEYNYLSVDLTGIYCLSFYDNAWHEDVYIDSIEMNWDKIIGSWKYRNMHHDDISDSESAEIIIDITQVTPVDNESILVTYSGSSWLYNTYINKTLVDEKIENEQRKLEIVYETEEILGCEVELPSSMRSLIMPWEWGDNIGIEIHKENGMSKIQYDYYDDYFEFSKVVSEEEIQDALDKLNDMNS